MEYKIRKLKTVGLRQGAPTVVSLALEFPWEKGLLEWSREHVRRSWIVVRDRLAQVP
jgi:hypothetical protein